MLDLALGTGEEVERYRRAKNTAAKSQAQAFFADARRVELICNAAEVDPRELLERVRGVEDGTVQLKWTSL